VIEALSRSAVLVLVGLEWPLLVYFLCLNTGYGALLCSAAIELLRYNREVSGENRWRLLGSRVAPTISVLAPAHNEAATIAESVRGLLTLYYPNLEVVVINDGSSDATMTVLTEQFALEPVHPVYQRRIATKPVRAIYRSRHYANLWVADKEKGGKADALNAGLNMATAELVCSIDADTLIEPDALQRMVRPFLMSDDTVAAGGTIRVVNGSVVRGGRVISARAPRRALAGFQVVEYLRAFLFGRLGWNRLGGNVIISGAFGLFRREQVIAVGGYTKSTVGEDIELVLRLRRRAYEERRPHRVDFIPDSVAWTEVPELRRILGRQRDRWHRGLAESLWCHRQVLLNPRYGAMGMIVFPFFFFGELLAPVIEATSFVVMPVGLLIHAINIPFTVLFLMVAYGYGFALSVLSLALDVLSFDRYHRFQDKVVLLGWTMLEYLGYHQLTVIWRLRGLIRLKRGTGWGKMERRGFGVGSMTPGVNRRA
jgi:cellulose synthase/poly-beta-1,6-N-acetylglucosamine synthase-like glycosyltransferase